MPNRDGTGVQEPGTEQLARRLDWNLLHTFVVIVEEGSITRAAGRLGQRQPSLSNALKRLEGQLGRRLIERGNGVFRITEAGRLLYREAVDVHGSISRLPMLLRDVGDELSGHVTAALASHVVCPFFDDTLAEFHRRHPGVTYAFEVATSAGVIDAVAKKSATFGVCLVHRKSPQLHYRRMYREHFGFFCGPTHPLFGRRDLALRDLRDASFVSFETDRLTDALRPVALLRVRENIDERIIGRASNLEEVRRMILAGVGVGPLPIHVVERDVRDGLLWQLPPYQDPPAIDIFLVTNPRCRLDGAERAFLAMLESRIDAIAEEDRVFPPARGL